MNFMKLKAPINYILVKNKDKYLYCFYKIGMKKLKFFTSIGF